MAGTWRHRLGREWTLFKVALQFLTRVPVPAFGHFDPAWLQACVRWFPAVGLLVGLWAAAVMALALWVWPPGVAVAMGMAATVWLTGAFHEDGWADTWDALGGAVTRQRALDIMKDSRLGTYGVVALVLVLALKGAALVGLLSAPMPAGDVTVQADLQRVLLWWTCMATVSAHVWSRLVPVLLLASLPYAGDAEHAKAKPLALQAGWREWLGAAAVAVALTLLMAGWVSLSGWPWRTWWMAQGAGALVALVVVPLMHRWLRRRLGGFTGDALGASQQLAEVAVLLAWLAVVHPSPLGLA